MVKNRTGLRTYKMQQKIVKIREQISKLIRQSRFWYVTRTITFYSAFDGGVLPYTKTTVNTEKLAKNEKRLTLGILWKKNKNHPHVP